MAQAMSEMDSLPEDVHLPDGRRVTLRAVRPGDRDALQTAIKRLSTEARYSRFMSALHELPPRLLEQAVNPREDRELQLVAVHEEGLQQTIVGGARYSAAAGSRDCEFAIAVADDWQRMGLARRLLEALIREARSRGFERMEGYILASNARMLGLAKRLGFARAESPEGPTVLLMRRCLTVV